MKKPGVCLRRNRPCHLSRSTSLSEMAFQPCSANVSISLPTSRPSFSSLYSSILFIAPSIERKAKKNEGAVPSLGNGVGVGRGQHYISFGLLLSAPLCFS